MTMRAARLLGALSILGVGAVHLQQYSGNGYSTVPTIGTLFLLNAISAGVVGFGLLLPLERVLGRRRGSAAVGVLSLAGVAIAVGSLIALFISETGTLFGFSEGGYRSVIVIAIVVEALATVLLTPLAAVSIRRALARKPQRPRRPTGYAASRSA
jgi:MFS family permease